MRRFTLTLILLVVSPALAFAQDRPVPQAPDSARQAAAAQFQQEYGPGWQIAWHQKAGTPAVLMNGTARGYAGPPEQAGRAFLKAHKQLFGIENARQDLKVARTNRSGDGSSRVRYRQMYRGLPVLNSGYLVALDEEGAVHYVSGDYYSDLQVDTSPELQGSDIVEIMRSDLGGASSFAVRQEPVLSVFVDDREEELSAHLAYEARAERRDPLEAYKYIVDAQSGELLQKISLIETLERTEHLGEVNSPEPNVHRSKTTSATGTGGVYLTNPLHGSPTSVTLHRLDNVSPQVLEGDNIAVTNAESSDATSSTGEFTYSPSNTHFDEVMTYYHSDEFEDWLVDEVGMAANQVDCQVSAQTHSPDTYAGTDPPNCLIAYGDENTSLSLDNPTQERSILDHEYMHVVSYTYNSLDQDFEADALNEGYSDFFAVADRHANTSVTSKRLGAYVGLSSGRTVDNSYQVDDFFSNDPETRDLTDDGNYSEHDGGVVLAGALWDFQQSINDPTLAAEITLASLNYLDGNPSFFDARNAVLTAADNTGNSQHKCDAKRAFEEHGIGNAFVVNLSGPGSLDSGQEGTWSASVSCGNGSISYDWKYQPPGSSSWYSKGGCSSSSCSHTFYNSKSYTRTAKMRVIVSDGTETEADTDAVGIIGSDGDGTLMDVLPGTVEGLVSRKGDGRSAKLRWSTTGSFPVSAFVIEHRTDSTGTWSTLGTVPVGDSVRTNSTGRAYRFETDDLEVGTHQFRLAVAAPSDRRPTPVQAVGTADANGGRTWTSEAVTARIEVDGAFELSAYPNPVRERATVRLAVKEQQHVAVEVYDVLGRRAATLHEGPVPAQETRRFRLGTAEVGLSSGTYFVRVRGETFAATRQLTVVR